MDEKLEKPLPQEAEETAVAGAEPSPLPDNPDAPPITDLPAEAGGDEQDVPVETEEPSPTADDREAALVRDEQDDAREGTAAAEPSPLAENPDAPAVADLPAEAGGQDRADIGAADEPAPLEDPGVPVPADVPPDASADEHGSGSDDAPAAEPSPLEENPDALPVADLPAEAGGVATDDAPALSSAAAAPESSTEPLAAENSEEAEQLLMAITSGDRTIDEDARRLALLEAIVYVTDEPLSAEQIAKAMNEPLHDALLLLDRLVDEYNQAHHGLTVKEVAGGYKMATKPEHHEAVRAFVKNLNPPLKLSLAALETLAVIAYKQPITAPEIMEIRGVQGAGVLKTLIDRKLITTAGRKNVVGKPILYKTTKEFLVQFGLRDLNELPTLKEFEDLRRLAFSDGENEPDGTPAPVPAT